MEIPVFVPKAVHYPAAGKNQILVSGEVDGELRNAPLIEDAELAGFYREAEQTRAESIDAANKICAAKREALDKKAFELAVALFIEAHTPKKTKEPLKDE